MAAAGAPNALLKPASKSISTGPYTLRALLGDVPLSADGETSDIAITCVEYWDGNLYVGTSAAEILHFVSIPGGSSDGTPGTTFILASRLEPSPSTSQSSKGVQQIILLPRVNKACIRCNNVLTFYSLPELSPAFANTRISNCSWIGGRDLDVDENEEGTPEVMMICIKSRIRLVRIGEEPRLVKNIEYPACLASARRGRFVCVADAHSYALLDVENQQKIPLFPISSLDEDAESVGGGVQDVSSATVPQVFRGISSTQAHSPGPNDSTSHGRSTSLGAFMGGLGRKQQGSRSRSRDRSGIGSPEGGPGRQSPKQSLSPSRAGPDIRGSSQAADMVTAPMVASARNDTVQQTKPLPQTPAILRPHISSPIASEFLLTTGTSDNDPGVGIFVNCDGDVVRGTLEFGKYPTTIITDGGDPAAVMKSGYSEDDHDGYVLAAMERITTDLTEHGLEIQRWDVDAGEGKAWLAVPNDSLETSPARKVVGLGVTRTAIDMVFSEIAERLRSRRLRMRHISTERPISTEPLVLEQREAEGVLEDWEVQRNKQEDEFASRLCQKSTRVVTWSGSAIFWVARNPILLKFDATIDQILHASLETRLDQSRLVKIVRRIRKREAKSEAEFLSLEYIRQKISLILFADIAANRTDVNPQINEHLFVEGGLDPRVILSMVPLLQEDIVEGSKGIWIHEGLVILMERQLSTPPVSLESDEVLSRPEEFDLLGLIKRYLSIWRQRKGFGSIADETQIFSTVDAALLHVLLYQDQQAQSSSIRAELYAVVDHGVDCFDRAVELLEEFHRLYVLSRLYQSRKMAGKVLATWRRIIEGEHDDGGELVDGENEVRKYLVKIKDLSLIEEYGTWLANRNPALGVQVFTDDNSRVKLPPNQVVQLLRLRSPDAVKVYLEHLVFGKKNVRYANDLISYYLDNVLAVLESSSEARATLAQSYESYRALHPPKPTYRQFIVDNAIPASWWHDRLRLLELLGGSHGAGFSYDVPEVLGRIEPFEDSLVPESIILDGRQGRHSQALRLLTHGLGDYHTAVNYCLLGGSSIYHPTSGPVRPESIPSREEQAALFRSLLYEFLHIDDISDRVERTSELLERFGAWFDVAYVLNQIPDEWSVDLVSAFLVSALRRLVQDKSEAMITKALSGAENLKVSADFIEKCEALGPQVESVPEIVASI